MYIFLRGSQPSSILLLISILLYKSIALQALVLSDNDTSSSIDVSSEGIIDGRNTPRLIEEEEGEGEDRGSTSARNQDEEDQTGPKFAWKNHQDDHSIYAHRSLISTAQIKHPLGDGSNDVSTKEDMDIDDLEVLKTNDFAEKEWQLMFRSLDLMYDSVSSSILQQIGKHTNLFDEVVSRLEPQCKRDIYHTRESVKKHRLWALRMLDSNGKLPSGITYGRFSSPGDWEECLSVKVDENVYRGGFSGSAEYHKFTGKYCLIDFRLPLPERPKNKLLSVHESVLDLSNTEIAKQFPQIMNYSAYASAFYEVGYMHALCLPSTCKVTDLTKSIGQALEGLHLIVNNTVDCEQRYEEAKPLRRSQIISIILFILLFINAGCASIVYYLKTSNKYKEEINKECKSSTGSSKINKENSNQQASRQTNLKNWISRKVIKIDSFYAECFSIQTNLNRLTKPDPRGLTFVHYTRIIAMALTVVTHTAALGTLQAITKPADTSNSEQIFRDLIPQMLTNAFTSIQIFFFMAGFMLVISAYPSIQREKGHISFVEYAVKRAIRLMPGIAATIGLNFLWPLIVDGPMLTYFVRSIVTPCESNWWRTLGFLSNFDHVEKICLRHSYFSASDYQLHLMAFPLLILLYKQPNLSLTIAGLLTVAGFASQVIMVLTKTVLPFMMVDYIDKEAFFNVVHYIHHPCWNHMSAFFYGFIIGYLVVKQIRVNLSATTIKCLWLIILPAGIVSIFAPYFWNHYKRPIYKWQMVLYVLIDRFILLTTCAWLSYATMVLARRPTASKKKNKTNPSSAHLNLPNIISIGQDRSKDDTTVRTIVTVEQPSVIDSSRLATSPVVAGIPRQRSSPNFLSRQGGVASDQGAISDFVRPAISSVNVLSNEPEDSSSFRRTKDGAPGGGTTTVTSNQQEEEPKEKRRQQAPSNVNTLCLILSRLTFQLYLFNMVVLWVDVNNSKYIWFFSYYFIIMKAAAVYIASSLLAMVFFITLESPCLTLYIVWVKMRAQARARLSQPGADADAGEKVDKIIDQSLTKNQTNKGKVSPESDKKSVFDGLCMKTAGNSPGSDKPKLGVIDLYPPPPDSSELTSGTITISQTKM